MISRLHPDREPRPNAHQHPSGRNPIPGSCARPTGAKWEGNVPRRRRSGDLPAHVLSGEGPPVRFGKAALVRRSPSEAAAQAGEPQRARKTWIGSGGHADGANGAPQDASSPEMASGHRQQDRGSLIGYRAPAPSGGNGWPTLVSVQTGTWKSALGMASGSLLRICRDKLRRQNVRGFSRQPCARKGRRTLRGHLLTEPPPLGTA